MIGSILGALGTSIGRKAMKWGALALVILFAVWRIFTLGKQSQKAERNEDRLEAIAVKREVDDEASSSDIESLRNKLRAQSGR